MFCRIILRFKGKTKVQNSASLYAGAELILRVLDGVEKSSFVTLPGKQGHSNLMSSKPCIPTWRR